MSSVIQGAGGRNISLVTSGAHRSIHDDKTLVNADKDVAVLPYSSGTTGLPKGVMVTHANLAAAFMQFSDPRTLITSPEDVQMVFLPFFHSLGFIMMFSALFSQYTSVLLPRFTPEVFLKVIEEYKVTFFAAVPPVVLFLSQAPLVDKYDISSLRRMFCAAAPLSADLQDALQKRTGGKLEVRQAYGMTESVAAISVSSGENRIGSVGQISGYMQVKIVDLETQSALGPRKEGEICLRGPQVTPGYYKNQVATAETFDQEGWLRTGDVGYYDEDGFLYIVDRIKELIKYKGMQVAPAELEGLLLQHPEITDAAVVGRPDPRVGELPTAFVAAAPGAQLTQQLVQDYIAVRVSDHKHLRGGVVFLEVIPRTSTGKIARKEVKQLAKELKQ
ncbi:hypothetical protein SK128_000422 [Halocaridina rubra]|uniref:Uncharacterized protein n=1 Tax=Halocaridina rubra TaxID=373956 RepID=A0AAN8XS78_HALRR